MNGFGAFLDLEGNIIRGNWSNGELISEQSDTK